MRSLKLVFSIFVLLGASLFAGTNAFAQSGSFEVTVVNLTRGQSFTPIFVASHVAGARLFNLGQPASTELATLAEAGDTAPLEALVAIPEVIDVANSGGLLEPGGTATITVSAEGATHISVASMLIPTNDTFFAANGVMVPDEGDLVIRSPGYDAGSEPNDESCDNIPGPVCGGEGLSENTDGEGYVHIQAGIHGIGDLDAAERDWRNPVAEITIRRIAQ